MSVKHKILLVLISLIVTVIIFDKGLTRSIETKPENQENRIDEDVKNVSDENAINPISQVFYKIIMPIKAQIIKYEFPGINKKLENETKSLKSTKTTELKESIKTSEHTNITKFKHSNGLLAPYKNESELDQILIQYTILNELILNSP